MSQRNVISATAAVLSATEDMKIIHDPETHAGRDGRFHSLQDSSLCPNIVEYLGQRFPNGLYSHQHDAIENVLAGKNTILATRTSSGKSLIYSLPALHMRKAGFDSSVSVPSEGTGERSVDEAAGDGLGNYVHQSSSCEQSVAGLTIRRLCRFSVASRNTRQGSAHADEPGYVALFCAAAS